MGWVHSLNESVANSKVSLCCSSSAWLPTITSSSSLQRQQQQHNFLLAGSRCWILGQQQHLQA
jgi:hypothetical protein